MARDETYVMIDDTNIVAYLHYRGCRFTPIIKDSGEKRIGFKVYGAVDELLSEFYNNAQIGIQDYVGCLKKVRGSMFLLKGMGEEETKQRKSKED